MSVEMTYDSLGSDGLSEIVNLALERLRENIDDPNTDAKKLRKVSIEIAVKPNEQRNFAEMSYAVKSTLAPVKPVNVTVMIEPDSIQMPENGTRPDQHELPLNVTPFVAKEQEANG